MKKMNVTVIGLGGVGGYFGFKLASMYAGSEIARIAFVARGTTFQTVSHQGLTLLSPEHEVSVCHPSFLTESIAELPETDIFLICVKEYDLEQVCQSLKSSVTANTILLPLMNGADIYERIRKIIPNGIVLPACVYVASHIKEKGVVEHKGKPGKIYMGKDPLHPDFEPEETYQLLKNAGINISYTADAFPEIWRKFLFIASFGLVTARYNKSIGELLQNPALKEQAAGIMQEIKQIAEKKGIGLTDDAIEKTFERAATFPPQTPTSLQLDVQAGKSQNELELFAGTIIRYGKELNIATPVTERIYAELKNGLKA
ncbi:ketopantoate reductase family protein [Pontibacter arcticus]|uniref:2-dehydropantoate 2-reductase n=1 Tax=Pontibacter arcticus TaxID=2080288 RepID=A0A364RCA5_9BACT|nr:2-dehydropantoate 2-reductase [Pontibacter arcticus]RAU81909.1 2-dehydropantoate 2-reductase [Pontibacter arcticus]